MNPVLSARTVSDDPLVRGRAEVHDEGVRSSGTRDDLTDGTEGNDVSPALGKKILVTGSGPGRMGPHDRLPRGGSSAPVNRQPVTDAQSPGRDVWDTEPFGRGGSLSEPADRVGAPAIAAGMPEHARAVRSPDAFSWRGILNPSKED